MRQPLITNYIIIGKDKFGNPIYMTNNAYLDESVNSVTGCMSREYIRENVKIEGDDMDYYAELPGVGRIGEFQLYKDNNGLVWINFMDVVSGARRSGVATKMYLAAKEVHAQIYASRSGKDAELGEDDTRHLSSEGAAFVNALIEKGLMKAGNFRQV
ncbi:hypothetical protein ACM7M8_02225 [Pseudomonas aeruginosa]